MDIAIALILPFVVYYGIYLDLGQNRDVFPRAELHLLLDGATAFFLFALAVSTGLSISTGSGLKGLQRYLLKRGLFFLLLGGLLSIIWPTNIFILLGACSLISALIIPLNSTFLFFVAAMVVIVGVALNQFGNAKISLDPWDDNLPMSLVKHIATDGYYAVVPWLFFWLLGIIYSRGDFFSKRGKELRSMFGLVLLLIGIGIEFIFENWILSSSAPQHPFSRESIFDLHLPAFIFGASGLSIIVFNFIMSYYEKLPTNAMGDFIRYFGKMKYSILAAQGIVGGILGFKLVGLETYGAYSVIGMGIIGTVIGGLVSYFWTKRFGLGPVVKVLKMLN